MHILRCMEVRINEFKRKEKKRTIRGGERIVL